MTSPVLILKLIPLKYNSENLFLMTIEDLKKVNFDTFHSWVEAGIITEEEWQRREEIVCKKVYGELPESLRE